jgi:hypothetical protein
MSKYKTVLLLSNIDRIPYFEIQHSAFDIRYSTTFVVCQKKHIFRYKGILSLNR